MLVDIYFENWPWPLTREGAEEMMWGEFEYHLATPATYAAMKARLDQYHQHIVAMRMSVNDTKWASGHLRYAPVEGVKCVPTPDDAPFREGDEVECIKACESLSD